MKRAVIATKEPWHWLNKLHDYSIMVVNPDAPASRYDYLMANSDYSLLITDNGNQIREGADYPDERIFLYTSGTTGDSKFYGFTQAQLDQLCDVMLSRYHITTNDRYYGVMPLWHAHGQAWYWATQRAGCESKFGDISDRRTIEEFQPTFISAIPKMLKIAARFELNHLRFLRSASTAMPPKIYTDLVYRFGVPVIEAFGMTEALSHCFSNPLHGEQRRGTVGFPDGIEAQINQQHLFIKGPCLFQPGWIDTGDLASVDSDGYFTILGRHQDQINVNGIKINPLSIENHLYEKFPNIGEIAVFGKDRVNCIYTGEADQQSVMQALLAFGSHCRPLLLEQVSDIPKNGAGKVSRTLLQEFYI